MINKEISIEKKEREEYDPLPENIYQVELIDINDEEKPTYDTRNKADSEKEYETVLNFRFALLGGKDKKGESLRGRNIFVNFVPTYLYIGGKNGKNKLYQIVEAMIGRELTQEEEAGGIGTEYLNGLINKQCRIGTKNSTKNDKTYSNADVFYPSESDSEPLSDEEKETQFKKKEENDTKFTQKDLEEDEINVEDIPLN